MTSTEIHNILAKCRELGFQGNSLEELLEAFIIYLRKSRKDDEIERYIKISNPDITKEEIDKEILKRHESQIQAYAKQTLGFQIPEKNIRREIKSGGELEERPVMKEIMLDIEDPSILGVLVYDIDRIGRPDALDTGLLIQAFELTNTKILVATPPKIWDLTNEFDKEYFEDSLRQARKFLNYTKTKMVNGRKQSVREGKFIGSTAPFGYDRYKLPDQKGWSLKPNMDSVHVVDMFNKYVHEGYSYAKLARYLNKKGIKSPQSDFWQPHMVSNILSKETYIGYVTYGKHMFVNELKGGKKIKKRKLQEEFLMCKGLHEAIIDEDTFNKVKEIALKRDFIKSTNEENYKNPLGGLVKCKNCGYAVVHHNSGSLLATSKRRGKVTADEFVPYFLERKKEKKLTYKELCKISGVSIAALKHYGNKKAYAQPSVDNYFKIKKVLEMDDRFDVLLEKSKVELVVRKTLACINLREKCNCVSSPIEIVEAKILEKLKERIEECNSFIDGYEQDEVKIVKNNKRQINKINKEIEGIKKQITVACDMLEKGIYTDEMFLNRINDLNEQISQKEKKIEELDAAEVEKEIVQYKRQVPVLENVIKIYHKLSNEEKNELLRSFINKVYYYKEIKSSQTTHKNCGEFTIDIDFKEF